MANTDVTLEKNQSSSNINEGSILENSEVPADEKPPPPNPPDPPRTPDGSVSIYVTSSERALAPGVDLRRLLDAVPELEASVAAVDTGFGVVVNLADDGLVRRILGMDLGRVFGKPVQAVPLYSGRFRRVVSFEDVPWCIRDEELEACLRRQDVVYERLTREKSTLHVEVCRYGDFRRLREEGINFYDSVVFRAAEEAGLNEEVHYNNDNVIQCYKCQGFWHTANVCKQRVRCVRCGEEHHVDACPRPKSSPVCCNCKGPHHAAYRLCPLRLKLKKSVRVAFTFDQ